MRILLLTAYFPPDTGSAPHLFHELGRALVKRGHAVTVVTTMPGYQPTGDVSHYVGQRFLRENLDGMDVVRSLLLPRPAGLGSARAIWQLSTAMSLWSAARKLPRYDAAIVLSPPLFLGMTAAALHTPFLLNVQDLFPQSAIDLGVLKSRLLIAALRGLESWVYRRAAHLTVHSEGNLQCVLQRGVSSHKATVLPNWIDTDELRPGERHNEFRHTHQLDTKFVVTFAGVLGASLGIEVIAEAADLLREDKQIQFLIAGDGIAWNPLVARVRELKLNNVLLLPMRPKSEYPDMIAATDVCLVMLRPEVKTPVVPGKINSIMAAGRPIIASVPEGDAAALVRMSRSGIVVPAGDPKALADGVLRLRSDTHLRAELGANGRQFAENHLSVAATATRVEALLQRISAPRGTMN